MAKTTKVTITFNRFQEIADQFPELAMENVVDTIADIDADVQVGLAAGGTGRIYIRNGKAHQASSPGEMPANDMAFLAGSLQTELDERKSTGYYYTSAEYAPHLEYGTVNMEARPFMTPAAERARPEFIRRMKDLESRLR